MKEVNRGFAAEKTRVWSIFNIWRLHVLHATKNVGVLNGLNGLNDWRCLDTFTLYFFKVTFLHDPFKVFNVASAHQKRHHRISSFHWKRFPFHLEKCKRACAELETHVCTTTLRFIRFIQVPWSQHMNRGHVRFFSGMVRWSSRSWQSAKVFLCVQLERSQNRLAECTECSHAFTCPSQCRTCNLLQNHISRTCRWPAMSGCLRHIQFLWESTCPVVQRPKHVVEIRFWLSCFSYTKSIGHSPFCSKLFGWWSHYALLRRPIHVCIQSVYHTYSWFVASLRQDRTEGVVFLHLMMVGFNWTNSGRFCTRKA